MSDDTETASPAEFTGPWSVAIVMTRREYGGAEEGGWWYDTFDPNHGDAIDLAHAHRVGGVYWTEDEAYAEYHRLRPICDEDNRASRRYPLGSVLSRGTLEPHVFEGYPTPEPACRPAYSR